ncbi:MAG: chromosome segregation protein SMC [Nitrospirae bacterium]|nr:chromosome segregation protein SMC [Nitrospirota bacterium]
MRIRKLTLLGFKSFPEKTEFVFPEGLTCIVGPNGCGKTNIVDAIRFCLGEQSAKKLRGKSVVDMVFGGTSGKAAMNFADVSMTFDVQKGELPEPYHEIEEFEVRRVLYRSGESEYYINRTPSLLKDIYDLFYGTGLSPYSYGIMDQSDVTRLITMHVEERRLLLEEAAGITKFRRKRQEAERKMERTRVNLQRVEDVLAEVERQKRSLERQAKKAQKLKELNEELRAKELIMYKAQWRGLRAALDRVEQEETEEQRLRDELSASLSTLESERERIELESVQVEEDLRRLREEFHRAEIDQEQCRGQIEKHRADKAALERRTSELRAQADALRADVEAADRKLAELDAERRDVEENLNRLRLQLSERRPRREELIARMQSLREQEDRLEQERLERMAQVAELERVVASAEGRRHETEKRRVELESRRQQLLFSEQEMVEQTRGIEDLRAKTAVLLEENGRRLESVEEHLRNLSRVYGERINDRRQKRDDVERLSATRTSLQTLQETYSGFHEGARQILLKWGRNGIKGTVAEVLDVPERYRQAVEASLGVLLEAIVTDTRSYGMQAMDYLRSEDLGRAFFVALDAPAGNGASPMEDPRPENAERLIEKIQPKPGYESVAERLLSHVWVVDRIEDVFALPPSSRATYVTKWGEVSHPQGVLAGGAQAKQETASLAWLERKEKLQQIDEQLTAMQSALSQIEEEIPLMEARRTELESEREKERLAQVDLQAQIARFQAEKEGVARVMQTSGSAAVSQEEDSIQRTIGELSTVLDTAQQSLDQFRGQQQALAEKIAGVRREHEAAGLGLAETEKGINELAFTEVQLDERHQQLAKASVEIERGREQVLERFERLEAEIGESAAPVAALDKAIAEAESRLSDLQEQARMAREEVAKAEETIRQLRDRRGALESDAKSTRERLRQVEERVAELSVEKATSAMHMDRTNQEARERWGVEDLAALEAAPPEDLEALTASVAELRDRKTKMGDVNMESLAEYDELSQRFTFLTEQRDDIQKSIEQLREAIAKINRVCRERFDQIFEEVSKKFSEVFAGLVRGGKGELRLIEPPPLPEGEIEDEEAASRRSKRERGVDIYAKMPGKTMASLNLLSGGERALTAFSLLLSLFLVRPSPFCILDEVDGPLDDSNVHRFAQTIGEMGKTNPFLAITHNKVTMKYAGTLIGVTMEEDGISKLVSVKVA